MRPFSVALCALILLVPLLAGFATPLPTPAFVPEAAAGFTITPLVPLPGITSIEFGPGDHLYATLATGQVVRVSLEWTPAGPVARGVSTFASGFSQPLGLTFDDSGALYVADSVSGDESGRVDGRVTRVVDGEKTVIVSGLPNGRHNTNGLRFGPDGRLYVANGNPNDNGVEGGEVDVLPVSGAILAVDVAQVVSSPAVFRWQDENGFIPAEELAGHAVNADFRSKVEVYASGFRNVYDVAFDAAGNGWTATNGADEPSSQDLLYKLAPGTDYGFPFCYVEGPPGTTDATVVPNPTFDDPSLCEDVPPADALLGWHICATGVDIPALETAGFTGAFADAVYVAECGPFFAPDLAVQSAREPDRATHNTGHKVVRAVLDANGDVVEIRDFVTGLALPTDVRFGPDGAMYVGDLEMVYRVAGVGAPVAPAVAPPSVNTVVVAQPGSWLTTYTTPFALVLPYGGVEHLNLDAFRHNVVASQDFGDGSKPWCRNFPAGRCPLFWSALAATGQRVPVQGLEDVEPLRPYEFFCTLHPHMTGTLVALPDGAPP